MNGREVIKMAVNLCKTDGQLSICSESKWCAQKICKFSLKAPIRNCCIFFWNESNRCDCVGAQNEGKES